MSEFGVYVYRPIELEREQQTSPTRCPLAVTFISLNVAAVHALPWSRAAEILLAAGGEC